VRLRSDTGRIIRIRPDKKEKKVISGAMLQYDKEAQKNFKSIQSLKMCFRL